MLRKAPAGKSTSSDRFACRAHRHRLPDIVDRFAQALACHLPAETGVPLARWSCPELAREAAARGIVTFVPASTVRKVVSPNDFTDLAHVRDRLRAFEDRYNATAQPFQWRFTTSDLDDLPARLDRHTADHQEESSVALAA
ncbi:hypothetical protein AB0C52_30245 [Streptomyces sp. NPDC048717]|uniref:hypothetical protein n=1 Tax=Streptomyces sp. NPDC048717 TaxID=3154928 RepID=UPI00343EEE3B